jgi:predicted site-specific integrase-resolvase
MSPLKIEGLTLYTLDELAQKFKVTTVTLRSYIKKGKLRGQKIGDRWFVSGASLRDFLEGRVEGNERANRKS